MKRQRLIISAPALKLMRNWVLLSLLLLIGLSISCNNGSRGNIKSSAIIEDSTMIRVEVIDTTLVTMGELLDSANFVQLSSEPEALIGDIDAILLTDSLIIVRDMFVSKSVKVFSNKGNYLRTIGNYGRGPGEYIEPTFMQLYNNQIVIYDQFRQKLNFYDLNGKFRGDRALNFFSMRFHIFDDNNLIFNSINNDNQDKDDIYNYSIFGCDSLNKVNKVNFFRLNDSYESYIEKHNFFPRDSLLYFKPTYNDTIYSINSNGEAKVKFAIDFGKYTVPQEYRVQMSERKANKVKRESKYMFMVGDFSFTQTHLSFSYIRAGYLYDALYSLKERTAKVVNITIQSFFPIIYKNIISSTDRAFVGYFYPEYLLNVVDIENLKRVHPMDTVVKYAGKRGANLIMSMRKGDNPIITFFYPKNE